MAGTPDVEGLVITSVTMISVNPIFEIFFEWDPPLRGDWDHLELEASNDGIIFNTVVSSIESTTAYGYTGASYNQGTYYRLIGYTEPTGYGGYSNVVYQALWFDNVNDTASGGEVVQDIAETPNESNLSDVATISDEVTDGEIYYQSISDTATVSDLVHDAVIERLEMGRFLGSNNGKLFLYSNDYHGDNGATIPAWWESKDIDMDEQYPQFIGKYKYLHTVKLRFIDIDTHDVTISVSTDGGTSWTSNMKTVGSGTGAPREKMFNFWLHGRTFMVRVAHSSSDKDFVWTDMELQFEPAGDYFEVS